MSRLSVIVIAKNEEKHISDAINFTSFADSSKVEPFQEATFLTMAFADEPRNTRHQPHTLYKAPP